MKKKLTIRQEIKKNLPKKFQNILENLTAKFESQLGDLKERKNYPGQRKGQGRPYHWLTFLLGDIMAESEYAIQIMHGDSKIEKHHGQMVRSFWLEDEESCTVYFPRIDRADVRQLAIEIINRLSLEETEKEKLKDYLETWTEGKLCRRPEFLKLQAALEQQRGQEAINRQGGRPSKKITWKESTKAFSLAQKAKNFLKLQPKKRATPRQVQRHLNISAKDLQALQPCLAFHGILKVLPHEKWKPAFYVSTKWAFGQVIKNNKLGEGNEKQNRNGH